NIGVWRSKLTKRVAIPLRSSICRSVQTKPKKSSPPKSDRLRDVIVIVEHRDVPGARVAMRAEVVIPDAGEIEIRVRCLEALGHAVEHLADFANVERRAEILPEDAAVFFRIVIGARDFADE